MKLHTFLDVVGYNLSYIWNEIFNLFAIYELRNMSVATRRISCFHYIREELK